MAKRRRHAITPTPAQRSRARALVLAQVRDTAPKWMILDPNDLDPLLRGEVHWVAQYLAAGAPEHLIPYLTTNGITPAQYKANPDTIALLAALT